MQNNINMKAKLLIICTLLLAAGCTRTPVKNAGINYAYMTPPSAQATISQDMPQGIGLNSTLSLRSILCGEP